MCEIKILVSHRIDIHSELINNPIYMPVRCGAAYDKANTMQIQGDDTGDNISEHRLSCSEFTVQYWAWKNVVSDYYGLCHYRRFLSFADKIFPINNLGMVNALCLTDKAARKFGLLDHNKMFDVICGHDLVVSESAAVERYPTPKGHVKTVRELWDAYSGLYATTESIDEMFRLIDLYSPEYSVSAREYFDSSHHRGYNCYVMRKELFFRMCEFQFPIIFEIEKWLQKQPYHAQRTRLPGYIGEMLYGIFVYHVMTKESWRVKEVQLVKFYSTVPVRNRWQLFTLYLHFALETFARSILDFLFPLGTRKRDILKQLWNKIKRG